MRDLETNVFAGTAVLTQADNFYAAVRQFMPRVAIFASAMIITILAVPVFYYVSHNSEFYWDDFVDVISSAFDKAWIFVVGAVVVYLAVVFSCSAFSFWKMPQSQRTVTYAIGEDRLRFSDAAGVSSEIPWSMIKSSIRTKDYIFLKMQRGPRLYMALRAFGNPDELWSRVALHNRKK